jgi:hypothetical protein
MNIHPDGGRLLVITAGSSAFKWRYDLHPKNARRKNTTETASITFMNCSVECDSSIPVYWLSFPECHSTKSHSAKCHSAECHNANWSSRNCHCSESPSVILLIVILLNGNMLNVIQQNVILLSDIPLSANRLSVVLPRVILFIFFLLSAILCHPIERHSAQCK